MKRRTVVGAGAILLCLACSWRSDLIIANIAVDALTIRAQFRYDLVRDGVLPIKFADARRIGDKDAWQDAPAHAVFVDTAARTVHLTLPPGTAARLGAATNCDRPSTCDSQRFPLVSLELSGRAGSVTADRIQLREIFTRETQSRWVSWYPWTGVHGFWRNFRFQQAALLGLAIAVAAFTLWTAAAVVQTPMPRRWAWALVAILGIGQITINWTTGELGTQLVSLQFFGASMVRGGPLGPWVVAFTFPLGAILALLRRQRAIATARRDSGLAMERLGAPAA